MDHKEILASVTTNAGGDATVQLPYTEGTFLWLRYIAGTLATGADLTISGTVTGLLLVNHLNIGTSTFQRAYREDTYDLTGVLSRRAPTTGQIVRDHLYVNEPLTLTIAQGGNTLSGTFRLGFGYLKDFWRMSR